MSAHTVADLDIVTLRTLLASGEVSSREATQACLDRIEELDETLNAFVQVDHTRALEVADALDTMRRAGHVLGELHGVPLALKDNISQAGYVNAAGSAILAGDVASSDATVVERLKRAGAVILGRLNMHEFAQGVTTYNPHTGPTRNPWDVGRSPGGSSGGSGVAVAAREVFGALGTDTGCSVRLPAAFNGVTGIRPTIGRVSNSGVTPLAWSMDTVGPLARTAEDCGTILRAIAGHDSKDPATSMRPVALRPAEPTNLRVAVLAPGADRPTDPDVQKALDAALSPLGSFSAVVETVHIDDLEHAITALKVVNMAEPAGTHGRWLRTRADEYGDDLRTLMEGAELFLASHYIQAQRYRSHLQSLLDDVLRSFDVLVTPTVEFGAPPLGAEEITLPSGQTVDVITGVLRYNAIPSLTGLPAISLPAGFTEDGLPIGMQLIGRAFEEDLLVVAAASYQQLTSWHARSPVPHS
ncbi:amidase [Micromonospora sp. NPDC048830]|uniref:amidase n=1 Tax=Micromonospora sp. NPDC048830 TaxID=3364257 RepID=UPI0037156817